MGEPRPSRALAEVLEQHRDAIVSAWLDAVYRLPDCHYREHPREEVTSWLDGGLTATIGCISSGTRAALDAHIERIGRVRRELGFEIDEVIESLLLLREAALPAMWKELSGPEILDALPILDECLRWMAAGFAARYADLVRESLEKARERTEIMLDVAGSVSRSLDLDLAVQSLASGIATAMGGAYSVVYLPDGDTFQPQAEAGAAPDAGLRRAMNRPIEDSPRLDDLRARRSPLSLSSDELHAFLGAEDGELRVSSLVVFPILSADRVLALVLTVSPEGGRTFVSRQIQLGDGIASTVAATLVNARLHAETRRQLAESRSVQQVVTALLDMVGLTAMMEIVCREAQQLTGARGSALFLHERAEDLRLAFSSGLASTCADQLLEFLPTVPLGEPVVADVSLEPEDGSECADGPTSLLAMPLRGHERDVGLLLLVNEPRRFEQRDIRVCGLFADQAAIAIEHVGLHEQNQRMVVLEERQRLAQDLHDSVSQSIYGVTMYAEAAARLLKAQKVPEATENLREIRDTALEALRDMRLLIFELRPPALEERGLPGALQARLGSVEDRAGLTTELECEGVGRLPREIEESLHRIAQEALNNVLKHAHASRVSVTLGRTGADIVLEIVDNGVGFNVDEERAEGGLGLRGMAERSARLKGRLEVTGRPGSGTRVKVAIPLPGGTSE